jgi:hypothetical protein
MKVCIREWTSVLLTLWIPALGCPLSNRCCRCAGFVLQNECRLVNRVTDVCCAAHFIQSASTLQSGDTGLTLNLATRDWRKTRKCYPRDYRKYQGSGQDVCVCVCVFVCVLLWNTDSTKIKEAVFCNFGWWTYLHCCLRPPLPSRYSLWRRRITRKAGYNPQGLSRPVQEFVYLLLLRMKLLTLQNQWLCYFLPGIISKNSTFCPRSVFMFHVHLKKRLYPYAA